ncbi:hypothetical protein [Streptosporangium minutum]|uniref:NADPH-dependent reductive aminase-like C-terminal domain-containing protein n=1 Tax=Streptosporangium minutum TaxID=569862 RepID=A0A243RJX3_9ACTN|nr:hypothetical protein [Streptosporangium minutum]OUC94455.1 hypothetical protein CA984_22360 [Streptosporangium minutum]
MPVTASATMSSYSVERLLRATAHGLAPFARGVAVILPPPFLQGMKDVGNGGYPAGVNPITSTVSTMAHIVHTCEGHGIDASLMRAAGRLARRAIGLGHDTDGFMRVAEILNPR